MSEQELHSPTCRCLRAPSVCEMSCLEANNSTMVYIIFQVESHLECYLNILSEIMVWYQIFIHQYHLHDNIPRPIPRCLYY